MKTLFSFLIVVFCFSPFWSIASTIYIVNTKTLNVRSGPGIDYQVITQFKEGDKVEVIEIHKNWAKISFDSNKEGYVSSKYLTETNDEFFLSRSQIVAIGIGLIIVLTIAFALKRNKDKIPNSQGLSQSNIIITKSTKSVGIAILLAVIFPYLGILYASLKTFLWSFLSLIAFWAIIFYIAYADYRDGGDAGDSFLILGGLLTYVHYFISIILAGISANSYNKRIYREASFQFK